MTSGWPTSRGPVAERRQVETFVDLAGRSARRLTGGRPHLVIEFLALLAFGCAYPLAFLLRFDFLVPHSHVRLLLITLPMALLAKLLVFHTLGVFRILWAYAGIRDALAILRATLFSSAVLAAMNLLLVPREPIPRSILVLDALLTFLAVAGLYLSLRMLRESAGRRRQRTEPVLIAGAGDAGDALLRELHRKPSGLRVVGFLDDDPDKIGLFHAGVPVLGRVDDAAELARRHGVRRVHIAMPSVSGQALRRVVSALTEARLSIKILPPLAQLAGSSPFASQLRDVDIEDLLRRAPVSLEGGGVSGFLSGKVVLVTGAAGSIGSELCRQVLACSPARLVALDSGETPLHGLTLDLEASVRCGLVHTALVDVTDEAAVAGVFAEHRPAVVFHAAALKHGPLLEACAPRAVRVNVGGTLVVAEAAKDCAEAFVLISTDKAVRPTSVMGASKRIAERLMQPLNAQARGTRYSAVRFGNVLGSSGSVVPLFRKQIAAGGPVTVTHPEMRRFFMTIPEAVQLVLQAATLAEGGDIFVLDMGEPVRIVDLAEDLIRLSGLRPDIDVQIDFTGIRPGEKLSEALSSQSETLSPTLHAQVSVVRSSTPEISSFEVQRLLDLASNGSAPEVLAQMKALVPDYGPAASPVAETVPASR